MSTDYNFEDRDVVEGVSPLLSERWSPRAFEAYDIPPEQLTRIMDAARWSPSCFNAQPWIFYTSNSQTFDDYLDLLVEGNQAWAKNCSLIGFLVGEQHFARNGKPNDWFELDCGAAWMSLCVQARVEGLYTHGMGGIKTEAIVDYLKLDPTKYKVLMGFTIGKVAAADTLSEDLRTREKPSGRKGLSEIWIA